MACFTSGLSSVSALTERIPKRVGSLSWLQKFFTKFSNMLAYRSIFRKELLCSLSAGTVLYFPSFPIFDTACKISSILSSMNTMSLICSFSLTCGFRGSSLTFFFAITLSF